jgi:hypothetical protein
MRESVTERAFSECSGVVHERFDDGADVDVAVGLSRKSPTMYAVSATFSDDSNTLP